MKKLTLLFLAVITILTLLAPATSARAQDTNDLTLHIDQTDTTAYPTITVRLNAWDASGLTLAQLTANDFTLQEDGGAPFHPQTITVETNTSLGVVLTLDISGSMAGAPLQDAKAAAARFLDRLKAGDRAALVAFSDPVDTDPKTFNPKRELAFSTDLAPVYDLVEGLTAQGQTQLYNAELKAVRMAAALPRGHRAILLLSDGHNDPANIGDPEAAIELAKQNNIPFFIIGLGDQIDETHLRLLASETGGLYRSTPRSSDLAKLFSETATLLKTQYLLTYTSKLPADGKSHSLSVSLNLSQGQAEVKGEFGPLPDAASMPATATTLPAATQPASTVNPNAAPTQSVKATAAPAGQAASALGQPWAWPLAAVVALLLGLFFVLRRKRRPAPMPEVCANCGFDLTGTSGSCPQCGETRRLPKK